MFLTEAHRETMRKQGKLLDRYLEAINRVVEKQLANNEFNQRVLADLSDQVALERGLHMAVEIIIDMSNVLIDALIMRDPASYHDIVDIMEDEKVFDASTSQYLREAVSIRKTLVHDYSEIHTLNLQEAAQTLVKPFAEAKQQLLRYARA